MLSRLLHPDLKTCRARQEEACQYVLTHLGAGFLGLAIGSAWLFLIGGKQIADYLGVACLTAPLILAAALAITGKLERLQIASSGASALCLSIFASITGGLTSPFLPWLLLIPAEAAQTRRHTHLIAALLISMTAILALGLVQTSGWLPATRLPSEYQIPVMMISLVCGLLYAFALVVTLRQTQEKEVRRRAADEAAARFLAEHADDYVMRVADAEKIVFATPNSGELFSEREGLLGRSLAEFLPETVRPRLKNALVRAGYFGESVSFEAVIAGLPGAPRHLSFSCHPLVTEAQGKEKEKRHFDLNSPAGDVLVVGTDITDSFAHTEQLKADKAAALAQSRAKSHFLANMSHELRTPLNSILGFAQMIEAEMFGQLGHEKYKEYAGLIEESGNFLLELINDILDLSKIEAGKYHIDCAPVNLAKALERTLRLVVPQYRDKGIALSVDAMPEVGLALADPRAVRQILFNLLSNALKFTAKGGQVTVGLQQVDGRVVLSVADTGVGMTEKDLSRLAKPFEQAPTSLASGDKERSRTELGTGLGLALVRSLSELQGGSFEITSRLGEGTCVSVSLPIAKDIAPAPPLAQAA